MLVGSQLRSVHTKVQSHVRKEPTVGVVNGLAMYGPNMGTVIEVEATAIPVEQIKVRRR